MHRTKVRRRAEQKDVGTARNDVLVSVKSNKLPGRRNADLVAEIIDSAQRVQAALDLVGEGVPHSPELDVRISAECVLGGTSAAASTADQTDFQSVGPCRMNRRSMGQGESASRGSSGFQE